MAINQRVVIRSQFGAKAGDTPGNYIQSYTSRTNATEGLTPYTDHQRVADFFKAFYDRNQANREVVESVGDREDLTEANDRVTPQSARLFGSQGLVYSKDDMAQAIERTQRAMDKDHVLITPVISLTHDYLKEYGVVDPDLLQPQAGENYKGQVDQLKLRRGMTAGMEAMTEAMGFVSPEWTGAIHLNTQHVHCHVTLIETAPMDQLPNKRFAKSPLRRFEETEEGTRKEVPLTDPKGKILFENLGERGKIWKRPKAVFRQGLSRELLLLKDHTPYLSKDNPHEGMAKTFEGVLELSNSKLSRQAMRVHYHLPEDPEKWVYPSEDPAMGESQTQAEAFVDILVNDHPLALGVDRYRDDLHQVSRRLAGDSGGQDRLKDQALDDLQAILINRLYDNLKKVQVVEDAEPLPEDTQDHFYMHEMTYHNGLKYSVLSDRMLDDLLADSTDSEDDFHANHRGLALERRLRRYPERLRDSQRDYQWFDQLDREYQHFKMQGQTAPESQVMQDFYQVERDYHQDVRDKYRYLLMNRPLPQAQVDGVIYQLPKGGQGSESPRDYLNRVDWEPWLDRYGGVLTTRQGVGTIPEDLPPAVGGFIASLNTPQQKGVVDVVTRVSELGYQYHARSEEVSKDRFDAVKYVDLSDMVGDLNADQDSSIHPHYVDQFKDRNHLRQVASRKALRYLEATGQGGSSAFKRYQELHQDQVRDGRTVDQFKGRFPKPTRQRPDLYQSDRDGFDQVRGIPPRGAKKVVKALIPEAAEVVESARDRLQEQLQARLDQGKQLEETFRQQTRRLRDRRRQDRERTENDADRIVDTSINR